MPDRLPAGVTECRHGFIVPDPYRLVSDEHGEV
jgi:hypothetical protein